MITQSTTQTILPGNSGSCNRGTAGGSLHYDNSYWRAFNMAAFTGSQQYDVTSVSFGIETADAGFDTTQPVTIRLYKQTAGTFPGGNRTQIGTATVNVANQSQTIVNVPLAAIVPAGTSELIMELFTPDGGAARHSFFVGSNAAAQTGLSYLSAVDCSIFGPTDVSTIGFATMHILFNVNGSCGGPAPTPTPTPGPSATPSPATAQALNISTRLRVEAGDNVLIAGLIVTGNAPKSVAIRGIGPSLAAFGITDALADPTLELRASNGALIIQDDDWQDDAAQAAQLTALGLQLPDPKESGLVASLAAGASYTAILAGKNSGTGIGLVEVYDADPAADSQLANISTRGLVQSGNNVLIGGFILGGGSGSTDVAVRGIGPSLSLSPVLADPTLELHDGNGATLVSNDDWQDEPVQAAQLSAIGLAPQNVAESGIFASLPPGAFTAILAGKDGGTGIGLVEIYNVR